MLMRSPANASPFLQTQIIFPLSSTKNKIFQFKEFAVDQSGCAMKVNTDGVLLGVMTDAVTPERILDIGTGTGVIALILAQRFPSAIITAVEIDGNAASTAASNFCGSVFNSRLQVFHSSFENYFKENIGNKFDLIVSNPPFFIDSLRSDNALKSIARHTDQLFFETLIRDSALHLNEDGELVLIVPVKLSELIQKLALEFGLYLQKKISIGSFSDSNPHREIISLGFKSNEARLANFVIYSKQNEYSAEYRALLKDFFTIF